jgi:DNA gyrase subunit A
VAYTFVANTHDDILFFTTRGRVFQLKAHEVPSSGREAKGMPVNNLIAVDDGEAVSALLPLPAAERTGYMVMATRRGVIKRTALSEFRNVRRNGLIAVHINDGDELVWVRTSNGTEDVLLVTSDGRATRFPQEDVRSMGRNAAGVRGIRLRDDDQVVTMDLVHEGAELLTISERGYGKRTDLSLFPVKGRGGQGVYAMDVTDKTGALVAAQVVDGDADEMLIMSAMGQITRGTVQDVRRTGRNTQGVIVMRLREGDSVVSLACFRAPVGDDGAQADAVAARAAADGNGHQPREAAAVLAELDGDDEPGEPDDLDEPATEP